MSPTTAPTESSPTPQPPTPDTIFHLSLPPQPPNPTAPTILLLHGLLSSHLEWSLVIPHLQPHYHLLLVDLPGHSRSSSLLPPYTIPSLTSHVATLIQSHARNSKAHIVGMSMGGFITLHLARQYPSLCLSAFVSGATPFEGITKWLAKNNWILYYGFRLSNAMITDWTYDWLCRMIGMKEHRELRQEILTNVKWELIRDVYASIVDGFTMEGMAGVDQVRCLTVAGEKQDQVEVTRRVGQVWKETGVTGRLGSRAFVVRGAVHAWDLQFPEVFAAGIRSWAEGTDLPSEFEVLE
ncbi:Alpha/Beta hydrolase protein [Triangularia verruculosa]|uniref:Alpha/Beta hydrolase protein n=1 Tax=Triangularia verruculosa TaxID=2587418 RepID=A0AAN7AUH7_9PEZI|nr:Alpha/Beta hydrolase protein [Triangularia verruculosa]